MPATTRQKTRKTTSAISSPAAATGDACDDIRIQISNTDVDNALLDFDAVTNSMMGGGDHGNNHNRNDQLMPSMNIPPGGSLGTRSPSPSSDLSSLGSKRSRTDFDDNLDDNNHSNSAKKRAATPSAAGSAPIDFRRADNRGQGGASPAMMIRMDREREGRCPDCGLETHTMVRRNDGSFAREPLNIEGEVLNGRCLFCFPLEENSGSETSSQQFIRNVQHSGLSPIASSAHWPTGNTRQQFSAPRKQSPVDQSKMMVLARKGPVNITYQNNSGMSSPNMWQQRRNVEGDVSVSSVSCDGGVDTVDSQSVLTDDGDERSHRSGLSQNSGGMGGLGKAIASGMGMGGRETPRQQQHQRRNRAPDPPTLKSIPNKSPKPQTPNSLNSKAIARKHSPEDDVQRAVVTAHSRLPSSIYHHHLYSLEDGAEQAFIQKTLVYLESGSGDICDVVVAMRRFPFSPLIQSVACEMLYVHCFEREHAHAIGLVGGIRTIIDAMEHHPNNVALQQTCARMIKHLACASPYNLTMLDRMGAVGIILSTMERHSQNALLLEACCWAIEGMACVHTPEFKMRVARGGGIHAAMKAVETFPDNDALLRAAFHCLKQLGYNPSSFGNQQQQQQGGGIPQNILTDNGNQK
jgi:hypothetical protein